MLEREKEQVCMCVREWENVCVYVGYRTTLGDVFQSLLIIYLFIYAFICLLIYLFIFEARALIRLEIAT